MSDTSFPDSWQAADGKWYPMAAQPDFVSSVAPPVVPEPQPVTSTEHPPPPEYPTGSTDPSSADTPERDAPAIPATGTGRRPVIVAALAGALVGGLAIAAIAFGVFGDDGDGATSSPPFPTAEAGTDAGNQRDPLDSGSEFEVTVRLDDRIAVYSGEVHGIVTLDPRFEFDDGSCTAVVGEVTVESAPSRLVESELIVSFGIDDRLQRGENYSCNVAPLEEAGYFPLEESAVAVGESFSFYQAFPGESDLQPDHVVLGTFRDRGLYTYEAEMLDELPRARRAADDPDIELSAPGAVVEWDDRNGDIYEFSVEGYVEIGVSEFSDTTGRCFAVLASFTPVDLQGKQYGSPTARSFVLDDGVGAPTGFGGDCEVDDLFGDGYDFEYALVTEEFSTGHYMVLVVSMTGGPDAVVIGDPYDDNLIGFELDELERIPQV